MNSQKILQQKPLILLSIPLVFVLNAAYHYYGLLDWKGLALPISIYVVCGTALYFLLRWLLTSATRAIVFTSFLLTLFYFFSAAHQWLKESPIKVLSRYSIVLPLLLVLTIILFLFILKTKRDFTKAAYAINSIFLLLALAGLIMLALKFFTHAEKLNDQADASRKISRYYQPCTGCSKPNIYYLLLDGYTNSEILEKEFGYSNKSLEDYLTQHGFFVVKNSRSNYNFTHMSMASVFSLDYLYKLDTRRSFYTKEFLQSYYTMYRNDWSRILTSEGYRIRNYSIFDMEADASRVEPFLTELSYRSVAGQTFFNKLDRDIGWKLWQYADRSTVSGREQAYVEKNIRRIQQSFEGVKKEAAAGDTVPRFVYAHFILPHETFYFDSSGNRLPVLYSLRTITNKKDYLNQLVYTNKFIIQPLVDEIRKNDPTAVIILQGDHGYRSYPPEKIDLEFGNLNALFLPDSNYRDFERTRSSVNSFRILANHLFKQHLPLLPDSTINLMKLRTE